jgi:phage baseplate assembly protein W
MIDIKILTIRDLLEVVKVAYADLSPPSLVVVGYQFDQASRVLINDVEAPEFIVESSGLLLAQIPTSERASPIRSVVVSADKPSVSRESTLHFEVSGSIKTMKGLERLVQIFCRMLLQTPGSDRFHPKEGGGLLRLVGSSVSNTNQKLIQASAMASVNRARDQIMSRQAAKTNIPNSERLLSASVESIGFDASTTTLSCRVALAAVSGQQAVAEMTL